VGQYWLRNPAAKLLPGAVIFMNNRNLAIVNSELPLDRRSSPWSGDGSHHRGSHSPYFYADERALPVGVKAMTYLALDYLSKE